MPSCVLLKFETGAERHGLTPLERTVNALAALTGIADNGTWRGYVGGKFVEVRICEAAAQRSVDAAIARIRTASANAATSQPVADSSPALDMDKRTRHMAQKRNQPKLQPKKQRSPRAVVA